MKRAITLAGGGPAAGLHIGALQALQDAGISFDVWSLSCIGAWVGIIYNQWDGGDRAQQTYRFFRDNVFRDDTSYSRFPINTVFGPDLGASTRAVLKFFIEQQNYKDLVLPNEMIADAFRETWKLWSNPQLWTNEGDVNHWMLDQVLAVHPFSRFLTSLIYLSRINGLSKIYYPDSSFLKNINDHLGNLFAPTAPIIYHNAWNLTKHEIQLFSNRANDRNKNITVKSLCACSALPYIEETVTIDNEVYCEGALVDTVNFSRLIEDHPDLDEIWVSRIVDVKQVKSPESIKDALANLCMLFAGALGDDDVKLFKYHAKDEGWQGTIYELDVASDITFDWTHSNLETGRKCGRQAAAELLNLYFCFKHYFINQIDVSASYAEKLETDRPLVHVANAVTAHAMGRVNVTREAIKRLLMTDRAWYFYPERELGKTFYTPGRVSRLMTDLRAAGLP